MKKYLKKYLGAYLAMVVTLSVLEVVWFFYIIGDFFKGEVSHLLTDYPNLAAATLFYIFYPLALIVFVQSRMKTYKSVAAMGAFLGFTVYFIYDLTNYVTLFGWSTKLMLVDVLWGTIVTAVVSVVGFKFIKKGEN